MFTRLRIAVLVFLVVAVSVRAQSATKTGLIPPPDPVEVSISFGLIRSNAPPGQCGCFWLHGFSEALAYNFTAHWAAVGEAGLARKSNVANSGFNLNFARLLTGGRYSWHREGKISWFAQTLLGLAHQSGAGYASAYGFALQPGAGVDVAISPHLRLRPIELDYLRTTLPNAANNAQNSLRYSLALVVRF